MADLAAPAARAVRHRRSQRDLVSAPHEHLRAQARGATTLRPDGRRHRGHDGPEGLGPELALGVRLVSPDVAPDDDQVRGRGLGASDSGPAAQKLDRDPWLKRIFAGYAFALDYRDRRGHFYALFDQEETRRVTERQQPGACLQCHAANLALYRFVGKGDVQNGFERVSAMPYREARDLKDDRGQPLI